MIGVLAQTYQVCYVADGTCRPIFTFICDGVVHENGVITPRRLGHDCMYQLGATAKFADGTESFLEVYKLGAGELLRNLGGAK